jgi:hypothetical protein
MAIFAPGQEDVPVLEREFDRNGLVFKVLDFLIHMQVRLTCLIHRWDYSAVIGQASAPE